MSTYELFQAIDSAAGVPVSVRANLSMACSSANSVFKHRLTRERCIRTFKRTFFKHLNTCNKVRFRKVVRYALRENTDLDNIGEMLIVCGFPSFIHGYKLPDGEYKNCWKTGTRIRSYAHPMDKFDKFDHVLLHTYHILRNARINNLSIPDPKTVLGEMSSRTEEELHRMGW